MPLRVITTAAQTTPVRFASGAGPRLEIALERDRSNFFESLRAVLSGPRAPGNFSDSLYFRDCNITPHAPRRSIAASLLWHAALAIVLYQFGSILLKPTPVSAMPNFELTWSGPIDDLPLINPGRALKPVSPPGDPAKPLPKRGADAFDPRQTLISAPKLPNHPRQTLIRPDAPPEAPKILPALPNIVLWQGEPVRPKLQVSAEEFARMHAKQPIPKQIPTVAVPELPNAEHNAASINFAAPPTPDLARPALVLPTGASTVAKPKEVATISSAAEPPPAISGSGEGSERIIALSATPAPVAPPSMPVGNLSANVSVSPEGKQPGTPGGSPNGGSANGATGGNSTSPGGTASGGGSGIVVPGVSISGGNPTGPSGISGLGNGRPNSNANGSRSLHVTPGMTSAPSTPKPAAPPADSPIAEIVKNGAAPEKIFGERAFYTLHVNAPNTASVSGSWILKFAELDQNSSPMSALTTSPKPEHSGQLTGPVPIRKVDPRYPPAQRQAHIQGEVVLYAIIRANGSVDSIQVIRSLDPTLDQNAMEALAEWKFQPATRNGVPIALEAVVHIPFRYALPNTYNY